MKIDTAVISIINVLNDILESPTEKPLVTDSDVTEDQNPLKEEKGNGYPTEAESPHRYQIQVRRYSLILNDTRAGIEYTVAFPNPIQKAL
jgi:hypothetical protein